MPDSFARLSIQSNQAICEEIVADAVAAVEIKCGGARWDIDNSALGIERHTGPIVRCAAGLPGVSGPSAIPKLPGMRNGVKRPAQLAGSDVESANVARGRGKSLGVTSSNDQQIFVNDGWTGEHNGLGGGRFTTKIFAEVNAAIFCKRWNRLAGRGV